MKNTIQVCIALAVIATPNTFARPLEPAAAAPKSTQAVVIDRLPTKAETFGSNIEGTSFGIFGTKGSLGLGLLLGPIGVAANAAHVDKGNRAASTALSDLTKTDLRPLLRAAQTSASAAADELVPEHHYELLPVALIGTTNAQTTFSLRCVVHANVMKNGKSAWRARYLVIVDDMFSKDEAAAIDRAKESLPACFAEAFRLFAGHVDGQLRGSGTRKVRSDEGKVYKASVVESELPAHVIVADALGLMEYPRNALSD